MNTTCWCGLVAVVTQQGHGLAWSLLGTRLGVIVVLFVLIPTTSTGHIVTTITFEQLFAQPSSFGVLFHVLQINIEFEIEFQLFLIVDKIHKFFNAKNIIYLPIFKEVKLKMLF